MSSKTPIRTTTNGKPAPAGHVVSTGTYPIAKPANPTNSKMGPKSKSVGGAYMKKSKRKSMKKSRKSTRR
jgi:hypothetical protein